MENIKLVIAKNVIPKSLRIIFLIMGVLFIIQGLIKVLEIGQNDIIGIIQIFLGLFYLVYSVILFTNINSAYYIELSDSLIRFRNRWYQKEISLDIKEIMMINSTKSMLEIKTNKKDYKISFESLDYLRRRDELPIFLSSLNEIKEKNNLANVAP